MAMRSEADIRQYLAECERKAIEAMKANKWQMFGYWASQSVHLRKVLKLSHTPSPFRPFADLARTLGEHGQ